MADQVYHVPGGEHSVLGPSSADRWFSCPGSVTLAEQIGGGSGESSFAADEGTAAHEVLSKCLMGNKDAYEFYGAKFIIGEEKREIVLKVAKEVARYFKRRKLIANQVIEKELEDGGLIVSAKVGHPNQVLPIVRYWIPHIRVISPEGLQADLERELTRYVQSGRGNSGSKDKEEGTR